MSGCRCGDTYASHVGGGCDEIDCPCLDFEPTGEFSPEPLGQVTTSRGPLSGPPPGTPITAAGMTPLMPGGESTSAMLRRVQADLAASQADLTRAERERDEALSYLGPLRASLKASAANAYTAMRERDEAVRRAADLEQMREELKQLREDLAKIAATYRQDSITWAEVPEVDFIRPGAA